MKVLCFLRNTSLLCLIWLQTYDFPFLDITSITLRSSSIGSTFWLSCLFISFPLFLPSFSSSMILFFNLYLSILIHTLLTPNIYLARLGLYSLSASVWYHHMSLQITTEQVFTIVWATLLYEQLGTHMLNNNKYISIDRLFIVDVRKLDVHSSGSVYSMCQAAEDCEWCSQTNSIRWLMGQATCFMKK